MKKYFFLFLCLFFWITGVFFAGCSDGGKKQQEKHQQIEKLNITVTSPAFNEHQDDPVTESSGEKTNPLDY